MNKEKNEPPSKTIKQKKEEFDNILKLYLESNPFLRMGRKSNELEVRFGTNPRIARPISKIDYDNVVSHLYACGFKAEVEDGLQIMRIYSEYTHPRTGEKRMSNIRAEIVGSDLIQEYCKTNSIKKVIDMPSTTFNKLKFTQKDSVMAKDGTRVNKLDMEDFNFRVSLQTETDYNIQSEIANTIISRWDDSKKLFRFMNRVRFYHPDFPIFADLSIVKTGKTSGKKSLPFYTIQEANVFNNVEQYEIELEVDNTKVGTASNYNTVDALMAPLRKCIRIVLSGIQGSKFPISYGERDRILQSYMRLVHGKDFQQRWIKSSDFVGPSSVTLQLQNIQPIAEGPIVTNIRKNYTVTDKADGDRRLLYIAEDGKIYMIDTNMNVLFTGSKTSEKTIFESLLDGEHIKYDKHGNYINLYAAFDVYYVNNVTTRDFAFIPEGEELPDVKYRLFLLQKLVALLKPESIIEVSKEQEKVAKPVEEPTEPGWTKLISAKYNRPYWFNEVSGKSVWVNPAKTPAIVEIKSTSEFKVKCKAFHSDTDTVTIFDGCLKILSDLKDGIYEYNIDGLIFTPSNLAVGAHTPGGKSSEPKKLTWDKSFKWKPPEFNTVDFLVSIKKNDTGKDAIHHIFQDGKNAQGIQDVTQYKTLELRCGFNEKEHGFLNPCQDILDDNLPTSDDVDNIRNNKPVIFQPTEPADPTAGYTNVILKQDGSKLFMMTEENEYFEENMIVEFKYEMTNAEGWKWVPLRVRYDKTADLNAGSKSYGNAYHVANSNWNSIHNPITEDMITTGQNIPEVSDDIYYVATTKETSTRALRDFHNKFVKKKLITSVSNRGDTLIDYAVGKAGDLAKWIEGKLGFVFGIDISKDNIHNQLNGACSRFLKERKNKGDKNMPRALFAVGNSGLNIRNGQCFTTEKDKQIANAVFGKGPKDATILGKGVIKQYGVAENGFQISSCQFAMHYFFENKTSFHQFLRNISECTKTNGYFIGTCYDGKTVFDHLKNRKNGESMTIFKNEEKIYELVKMYDQTGFPDDELSLGYSINVYQESINQYIREYLVNFEYFTRVMEDYGFVLVTKEEAKQLDMPDGSGLFRDLFHSMESEAKRNSQSKTNYEKALLMSTEEKTISFMNRYFIFRKVRNVDAKKMAEVILKQNEYVDLIGEEKIKELEETVDTFMDAVQQESVVIKKINKPKLVLRKKKVEPEQVEVQSQAEPVPEPSKPVEVTGPIVFTGAPMKIKLKKAT